MKDIIFLELGVEKRRHIRFVGGKNNIAYLWIGDDDRCYGCVPDAEVEALRDMCNEVMFTRCKRSYKRKARK